MTYKTHAMASTPVLQKSAYFEVIFPTENPHRGQQQVIRIPALKEKANKNESKEVTRIILV